MNKKSVLLAKLLMASVWMISAQALGQSHGLPNFHHGDVLPSQALEDLLSADEMLVLNIHYEAIKQVQAMNLGTTNALIACLCLVKGQGHCEADATTEFTREFSNFSGDTSKQVLSCTQAIQLYVDNLIPANLSEMRRTLALAAPEVRSDDILGFLQNKWPRRLQMNVHIEHPVNLIEKDLDPLTEEEQLTALASIDQLRSDICANFLSTEEASARALFSGLLNPIDLCAKIVDAEEYTNSKVEKSNALTMYKLQALKNKYVALAREALERFRLENDRRYMRLISINHTLLLFKHAHVTDAEVYHALLTVRENAKNTIIKPTFLSTSWFAQEKWALPYTLALIKHRYPDHEQQLNLAIEKLLKKGNTVNFELSALQLGEIVGGFFLCNILPEGDFIKFLPLLAGRRMGCKVLYAATLNVDSFVESILSQQQLMERFLAVTTLDGGQRAVKPSDLLSTNIQVWFASVMLPVLAVGKSSMDPIVHTAKR